MQYAQTHLTTTTKYKDSNNIRTLGLVFVRYKSAQRYADRVVSACCFERSLYAIRKPIATRITLQLFVRACVCMCVHMINRRRFKPFPVKEWIESKKKEHRVAQVEWHTEVTRANCNNNHSGQTHNSSSFIHVHTSMLSGVEYSILKHSTHFFPVPFFTQIHIKYEWCIVSRAHKHTHTGFFLLLHFMLFTIHNNNNNWNDQETFKTLLAQCHKSTCVCVRARERIFVLFLHLSAIIKNRLSKSKRLCGCNSLFYFLHHDLNLWAVILLLLAILFLIVRLGPSICLMAFRSLCPCYHNTVYIAQQ